MRVKKCRMNGFCGDMPVCRGRYRGLLKFKNFFPAEVQVKGDGAKYFCSDPIEQLLAGEILSNNEADFTCWLRFCKPVNLVLLTRLQVMNREFRDNSHTLMVVYQVDKGFEAACLIVQIYVPGIKFLEFAQIQNLGPKAMPFFNQPEVTEINFAEF